MKINLTGQIGLVTGASRGIGRGCAMEMAKAGAKVAVNYYNSPNDDGQNQRDALEVVQEIKSLGGEAIAVCADVSNQKDVEEMVEEVVQTWGGLNLFVSNAAYSVRELMLEADMDDFHRTIDVSLWGAVYGVRAAAQQMVRSEKGGAITVLSSPCGVVGVPGSMSYNMAKAAVDQMARTAAVEFAKYNIRVNIVHPGWIDTPGERNFFTEEELQEGPKTLPIPRLGTISEIGQAVTYTLSDAAAFMTGSTLRIDGGFSLAWWNDKCR